MPGCLTDLYELTMAASYCREHMHGEATISLFVHRYLGSLGTFDARFLDFLGDLRFTGAVHAMAEGTVFGDRLGGVRLDSGDLGALSHAVRQVLGAAGRSYVRIFASGGLDEDEVARCVAAGASIDAFGVDTRMNVSADAPYRDMA